MCRLQWVTVEYVSFIHFCLYTERGQQVPSSTVVCEGNTHKISCSGKQKIQISGAEYGRTEPGSKYCPRFLGDWNTSCYSKASTLTTTKEECDGFQSCTLYANNNEYGDPCFGTYKYLKVCLPCNTVKSSALKRQIN